MSPEPPGHDNLDARQILDAGGCAVREHLDMVAGKVAYRFKQGAA